MPASFQVTQLSSKLEVERRLATPLPPPSLNSLAASRVRELCLSGRLPASYRPVNGVTVSLDGRDAIDYTEAP